MKKNTQLVNSGRKKKYTQGVVNPVVQRASTIVFDSVKQMQTAVKERGNQTLFYGRRGTQTHFALQDAITELENGAGCALYPCGTATLASVGTAGVPGVGLIMLAMVLNQVGLPVEGIAIIMGVDRLLDMTRTAVNVTGDCMVTCVVAKSENEFEMGIFNNPNAGKDT